MKEVVFDNGKLVLQKRKISQMDELFLTASKEHDKRKKESGLDFFYTQKDFLFVEDNVFETMNTYFSEDILNIQNDIGNIENDIGDIETDIGENQIITFEDIRKTVIRRPNNNMMSLHTKNRPDGGKL